MGEERDDLVKVLCAMSDILDDLQDELRKRQQVLSKMRADLDKGVPVGNIDTMFGVVDASAKMCTASRFEGRVWECLERAYKAERDACR